MKDYSSDKPFVRSFRDATLEIARRKMEETARGQAAVQTTVPLGPRMATGGHFGGFFLWDTAFAVLWARHAPKGEFPVFSALDNFYSLAEPDGFIGREYSPGGIPVWSSAHPVAFNPPILSWAELELLKSGLSSAERVAKVWPILLRHHEACKNRFRRDDGLYYSDGLGCGMDDIARAPRGMSDEEMIRGGVPMTAECIHPQMRDRIWSWLSRRAPHYSWNKQMGWLDASCQMAFDALCISELCKDFDPAQSSRLLAEREELSEIINSKCWDPDSSFYYDVWDGGLIKRKTAAAFWTLLSGVASDAGRVPFVVAALQSPALFGRPIPFPALAADDEDYAPDTSYWRGAVWPPTNYAALRGLVATGNEAFAEEAARRWFNANAALFEKTGTVWENLSAEQCDHVKDQSGPDFCGWGALAPVALPAEFNWI